MIDFVLRAQADMGSLGVPINYILFFCFQMAGSLYVFPTLCSHPTMQFEALHLLGAIIVRCLILIDRPRAVRRWFLANQRTAIFFVYVHRLEIYVCMYIYKSMLVTDVHR